MTATNLYYIILVFLIVSFIVDKILEYLNAKCLTDTPPQELGDIYEPNEYKKSQEYSRTNYNFGRLTSTVSFCVTLFFLHLGGFEYVDLIAREYGGGSIPTALFFFGIIMFAGDLISIPFSYYSTFVIEERFGFNKSTRKVFFTDIVKGWMLSALFGSLILSAIILLYQYIGEDFWIYAWVLLTVFTIIINMLYSSVIVPLFNKQTPLEDGVLKDQISDYAAGVDFDIKDIFVIDGSKRSSKANAYFSGFGRKKRITLYDTLIDDLEVDEIVAVLAHEVGHFKRKHIISNMIISAVITGATFYVFSLFVSNPLLSYALGVSTSSFHVGLIGFGLLYSPMSEIFGLLSNSISRRFEFQADKFVKETFESDALVRGLKKLSKNNLSNLTPHPAYVFARHSHPTLLRRIRNLR
tara:strand:- start:271 stop:1500 length:1230 start_codon:yes stop_codon:yes gene_type:complete